MNTNTNQISKAESNAPENKVYKVDASQGSICVPQRCTCCMKKTDTFEKIYAISGIQRLFGKKSAASFDMPLCHQCLEIRRHHRTQVIVMSALSVVISYLAFIATNIYAKNPIPFIAAFAVFAIVFAACFCLRKTADIENASTRGHSIKIKSESDQTLSFIFTNKEYAEEFHNANADSSAPESIDKKSNKQVSSYFGSVSSPGAILIVCIVVIALLCVYTMPILKSLVNTSTVAGLSPTEAANKNNAAVDFEVSKSERTKTEAEKENETKPAKSEEPVNTDNSTDAKDEAISESESTPDKAPDKTPEQSSTETANMPDAGGAIPYTAGLTADTLVYADVTSIVPSMSLSFGEAGTWAVCKCTTVGGSTVYICIPENDYISMIDNTAKLDDTSNAKFKIVKYNPAKRFIGKTAVSENVCKGLAEAIGSDTVIDFEKMI